MRIKTNRLFVFAMLTGFATCGLASKSFSGPLYGIPKYDPVSKSYFELVLVDTTKYSYRNSPDVNWAQAYELARARVFKGVRGELAVVDNIQTHEFLETTFQPANGPTWIGLRYWCSNHALQASNGKYWSNGSFKAWDAKWDHSAVSDPCDEWHSYRKPQYMPVAYTPVQEGFRWFATGWHKAYYCYFVEYPTGKP